MDVVEIGNGGAKMRYVVLILMLAGSCLAGEKFMRKATHEEVYGINQLKHGQCIQGLKYGYCVGGTNDPSRTMVLRGNEWFEIVPDEFVNNPTRLNAADISLLDTVAVSTSFHIAGVVISGQTGEVAIPTNMTVSVASKKFWNCLLDTYGNKKSIVKNLAKDGEICKVYGHSFPPVVLNAFEVVNNTARMECKFCKVLKVTKTVTEIIPAKEAK